MASVSEFSWDQAIWMAVRAWNAKLCPDLLNFSDVRVIEATGSHPDMSCEWVSITLGSGPQIMYDGCPDLTRPEHTVMEKPG